MNNDVKLLWVPGHEAIPGNQKADELARIGAESAMIGPDLEFPVLRVGSGLRTG